MPLARVQSTGRVEADNLSSVALTFSTPPTVGNGVLVGVIASFSAALPSGACTDNQGNTYVRANTQIVAIDQGVIAIYYCATVVTSGAPFTITISPALGAGDFVAVAVEVSGVGGGLAIEVQTANGGGLISNNTSVTTTTPTVNETFAMAALVVAATQATPFVVASANSPAWTEEAEELSRTTYYPGEIDTRLKSDSLTGGGTQNVQWTWPTVGWFAYILVAFKDTPGGPPVVTTKPRVLLNVGLNEGLRVQ